MRKQVPYRSWSLSLCLLALAVALSAGCRRPRERAYTKEQGRVIAEAIMDTRPAVKNPLDVDFVEGIRLVAVDMAGDSVRPGDTLQVTWTWEALADVEGGWKIFVHLEGPGRRSTYDHHPVQDLMPIGRWKKGQFIQYTQNIAIPADFPRSTAKLWVGVFDEVAWSDREENRRMQIANREGLKATVDGDQRVLLAELKISDEAAPRETIVTSPRAPEKPRYTAYRAPDGLKIDGNLDEPAWQVAPSSGVFGGPDGEKLDPNAAAEARVLWDDTHIYVGFTVLDSRIENTFTGRDATLWKADVVEIYLDPKENGQNYFELQVSPAGEIFDALFTSRRQPEWPEAAASLTIASMRAAVQVQGSLNDNGGDPDTRYTVEIAIPWAELPNVGQAPRGGEEWGFNLYRIDQRFLSAWAPAGGDFHNTSAFGRVRFAAASPPGYVAPTPALEVPTTPPEGETPPPAPTEGDSPAPTGETPPTEGAGGANP